MNVLVLGGTRFVGRVVVECALARNWHVAALHRGITGTSPAGAEWIRADRTNQQEMNTALGSREFDLVVDTWEGSARVAGQTAASLADRVGHFVYVSSMAVYLWGQHVDETSPVLDLPPDSASENYPMNKRGAELAILQHFPHALLARSGLIVGPREDAGRLTWWLQRCARGGRVVAPGRPDRPLQLVDVRDLAAFVLDAGTTKLGGPVDTASRSGHATTRTLLEACAAVTGARAELVWVDEDRLEAEGVQPWVHLPCWVPEHGGLANLLGSDTSLAASMGLVCRPVEDTVADTWSWLQQHGKPAQRSDAPTHGLPEPLEQRLLDGPPLIRREPNS
jgi:2'-hydroxyisoflavone reductase